VRFSSCCSIAAFVFCGLFISPCVHDFAVQGKNRHFPPSAFISSVGPTEYYFFLFVSSRFVLFLFYFIYSLYERARHDDRGGATPASWPRLQLRVHAWQLWNAVSGRTCQCA